MPQLTIKQVKMVVAMYCLTKATYETYAQAAGDTEIDTDVEPGAWITKVGDALVVIEPTDTMPAEGTTIINVAATKATTITAQFNYNVSRRDIVTAMYAGLAVAPAALDNYWNKATIELDGAPTEFVVPKQNIGQPLRIVAWREIVYETDTATYTIKSPRDELVLNSIRSYMINDKPLNYIDKELSQAEDLNGNVLPGGTATTNELYYVAAKYRVWSLNEQDLNFLYTDTLGQARGAKLGIGCYYSGQPQSTPDVTLWMSAAYATEANNAINRLYHMSYNGYMMYSSPNGEYEKYYPHIHSEVYRRLKWDSGWHFAAYDNAGVPYDHYDLQLALTDQSSVNVMGIASYDYTTYAITDSWDLDPADTTFTVKNPTQILWALPGNTTWRKAKFEFTCSNDANTGAFIPATTGVTMTIPVGADIQVLSSIQTWVAVGTVHTSAINLLISRNAEQTIAPGETVSFELIYNLSKVTHTALFDDQLWAGKELRIPVEYACTYTVDNVPGTHTVTGYLYINVGHGNNGIDGSSTLYIINPYDPTEIVQAECMMEIAVFSPDDFPSNYSTDAYNRLTIHTENSYGNVALFRIDQTWENKGGPHDNVCWLTETYAMTSLDHITLKPGQENNIGMLVKEDGYSTNVTQLLVPDVFVVTPGAGGSAQSRLTHPVNLDSNAHDHTEVTMTFVETPEDPV